MGESEKNKVSSFNGEQSLGEWLREKRLAQQKSVADMAAHLHLKPERIEAIENDTLAPNMTAYLKGYVRSYAKILAIDPEEVNQRLSQLTIKMPEFRSPVKVKPTALGYWEILQNVSRSWILLSILFVLVIWVLMRSWSTGHAVDEGNQHIAQMMAVNPVEVSEKTAENKPARDQSKSTESPVRNAEKKQDVNAKSSAKDETIISI